jgi:hypothetical protein
MTMALISRLLSSWPQELITVQTLIPILILLLILIVIVAAIQRPCQPGLLLSVFVFQFFIIIIFVLIFSIMPTLRVHPPTPKSAAIISLSSVTTSSQPAAIDTNLEALISDTTSSGSNDDEAGPIDFVDVVDAETQGQSMTDETPGPSLGDLPKKMMSKKHGRSEIWKYFEVFKEYKYKA